MNPPIADERTRIPRGGLAQNTYRAACVDARQNVLGFHPEIGPDPADAHALALGVALGEFLDFTPELLP
jgi:hypothetical protein